VQAETTEFGLGDVRRLLLRIAATVGVCEAAMTAVLAGRFWLGYGYPPGRALWYGVFHAVQGFNDSLRAELLHDGNRVKLSMVQLPAVNTPQFSWVRTRLPRHPQPVPPMYQPEVMARAVLWVADHGKRELNVGGPTLKTRLGNMVAPGLLDHYLWTTQLISVLIAREFRVTYHHDHVGVLLGRLGFTHQKPARRARERNEEKIQAWRRDAWPALLKKASTPAVSS